MVDRGLVPGRGRGGGGAGPNEFVFSEDGQTMYAATNDSTVQVWTVDGLVKDETLGDYLNYVRGGAVPTEASASSSRTTSSALMPASPTS